MRNTRSSKPAKSAKPAAEKGSTPAFTSGISLPESNNKSPPKVFILPKDTTQEARVVTLPHPRNAAPTRYFFCPEKGIYEFTKIAAPKTTPRSWLLAPNRPQRASPGENGVTEPGNEATEPEKTVAETISKSQPEPEPESSTESQSLLSTGYTTTVPSLFIATPIDPLFLLLPALAPKLGAKTLFLSLDDHFDTLISSSPHFRLILHSLSLRQLFEARIAAVCESVDAGDEKMYRLSGEKLMAELVRKAQGVVEGGLPASLEERFVTKALETPVMCIRREESSVTIASVAPDDSDASPTAGTQTPNTETTEDSQSTTASLSTTATTTTTSTDTTPSTPSATEEVLRLHRLRTGLTYITTNYLPTSLTLPSPAVDFTPLDAHLTHLSSLRAAAIAARSLGDSFSRKRGLEDDDEEATEERAEKKRKKEEEEKRKRAGESRAVRDLKKVDVKGMKKMSDFFKKKT